MKIECPICLQEELVPLGTNHQEYYLSVLTHDGTKKWYLCEGCNGIVCRDKMLGVWQVSPSTYDLLVSTGHLKDRLND
jgi:hypothetical protein